jgi:hypothetical protein
LWIFFIGGDSRLPRWPHALKHSLSHALLQLVISILLTRARRTPDADLAGFRAPTKKVRSAFFQSVRKGRNVMRSKLFALAALLVAPFMLLTPAKAEEFSAKMAGFHEAPTSIFSANGTRNSSKKDNANLQRFVQDSFMPHESGA